MELKERLNELFNNKRITAYQISIKTGISQATLSRVLRGNTLKLSMKNAEILANYFNVNIDWLMTGKGEKLKSDIPEAIRLPENNIKGIPLIPINAIAGFGKGEAQIMEFECERYVVPMFKGADFLIQVKGSSMIPKYNSGDVVACKKLPLEDIFFQWNKVYVLDTNQGPLVKRIKKGSDKDHLLIISDNPQYESFELHLSKVYAVALVVGVIRLE